MWVQVDVSRLDEVMDLLDPRQLALSEASALNKSAAMARTAALTDLTARYNVSADRLRKDVKVINATASQLTATLRATSSRGIGLLSFGATDTRKTGVTVQIKRGQASQFRHAFIASASGGRAVFERVGAKRLPIKAIYGPSTVTLFGSRATESTVKASVDENFGRLLDHEIEWRQGR